MSRLAAAAGLVSTGGVLAVVVLIYAGIGILNFAAFYKIITKAGYSGWWILLPLAPLIATAVTVGVVVHEQSSTFSTSTLSVDLTTIIAYYVFTGIALFVNWIFFLVFAFSDWPIRRRVRQFEGMFPPMAYAGLPAAPGPPTASVTGPFGPRQTPPVSPTASMHPTHAPTVVTLAVPAPQQPPAPSCPTCRAQSRPGSTFCGTCGTALGGPPAHIQIPANVPYVEMSPAGSVPVATDLTAAWPIHAPTLHESPAPTRAAPYPDDTGIVSPVGIVSRGVVPDALRPTASVAPIDPLLTPVAAEPPPSIASSEPETGSGASAESSPSPDPVAVVAEPYTSAPEAPVAPALSPQPPAAHIAPVFGPSSGAHAEIPAPGTPPPPQPPPSTAVSSSTAAVTCPSCSAPELSSSTFCGQCGARLAGL